MLALLCILTDIITCLFTLVIFFLLVAFSCPNLPDPNSGAVTYSQNSVGFVSTATYSCDDDFVLSGEDTVRICVGVAGSSGEWTGTPSTCLGI